MGHGDRLVIADGNFPSESVGKNATVIRMDGHGVPEILEAVLQLMPLDTYVEKPVSLMEKVPGNTVKVPVWDIFADIILKTDSDYSCHLTASLQREKRRFMPT